MVSVEVRSPLVFWPPNQSIYGIFVVFKIKADHQIVLNYIEVKEIGLQTQAAVPVLPPELTPILEDLATHQFEYSLSVRYQWPQMPLEKTLELIGNQASIGDLAFSIKIGGTSYPTDTMGNDLEVDAPIIRINPCDTLGE